MLEPRLKFRANGHGEHRGASQEDAYQISTGTSRVPMLCAISSAMMLIMYLPGGSVAGTTNSPVFALAALLQWSDTGTAPYMRAIIVRVLPEEFALMRTFSPRRTRIFSSLAVMTGVLLAMTKLFDSR